MLCSLKVSLLGRLGGINHISRAFFIALLMTVVLLPWQQVFPDMVSGMMFTPTELAEEAQVTTQQGLLITAFFYYIRFCGSWLIVLLLLVLSMFRSSRWTKATLKRLEIV
jgi:hypothetical protein